MSGNVQSPESALSASAPTAPKLGFSAPCGGDAELGHPAQGRRRRLGRRGVVGLLQQKQNEKLFGDSFCNTFLVLKIEKVHVLLAAEHFRFHHR